MPKYFCDYCDTYLTHDSPSVRKTHCGGRKHKDMVKEYYQRWLEDQVQKLVDNKMENFKGRPGIPPPGYRPPFPPGGPPRPPPHMGMPPPPMRPHFGPPQHFGPPRHGLPGPPPPMPHGGPPGFFRGPPPPMRGLPPDRPDHY